MNRADRRAAAGSERARFRPAARRRTIDWTRPIMGQAEFIWRMLAAAGDDTATESSLMAVRHDGGHPDGCAGHKQCYDFPHLVVHAVGCPRHLSGGVCRPNPQPVAPFTSDEAAAVATYRELLETAIRGRAAPGTAIAATPAAGITGLILDRGRVG